MSNACPKAVNPWCALGCSAAQHAARNTAKTCTHKNGAVTDKATKRRMHRDWRQQTGRQREKQWAASRDRGTERRREREKKTLRAAANSTSTTTACWYCQQHLVADPRIPPPPPPDPPTSPEAQNGCVGQPSRATGVCPLQPPGSTSATPWLPPPPETPESIVLAPVSAFCLRSA